MSHSITITFDPGDSVFVIDTSDPNCGPEGFVTSGDVVRATATSLVTGDTVVYDIRTEGNSGTTEFEEADIFADLASAVTEYQNRLTP